MKVTWIPLSKRKPEPWVTVLVSNGQRNDTQSGYRPEGSECVVPHNQYSLDYATPFTHWAPMPAPHKVRKGKKK